MGSLESPSAPILSDQYYMEKRQLFLRSYQFCRKRSVVNRIKRSFIRVRRLIWVRLRSAPKLRRFIWLRLRYGYGKGRFHFHRFMMTSYDNNRHHRSSSNGLDWTSRW